MVDSQNSISLKGGKYYITERETDAFRVKSGAVYIYIVPLKSGKMRRRSFLYKAQPGEAIPSFYCRDEEYCDWRFCFVAAEEEAVLEVIRNGSTKVLRKRFAEKTHILNYEIEGFDGGIIDRYKTNIVTEDGFIRRTEKERQQSTANVRQLIINSFGKKHIVEDYIASGNLLYDAANLLCSILKMPIASFEKVCEACGNAFAIQDVARISNFAYREIFLDRDWYKSDIGAFIGFSNEKKPLVCIPKGHGYIAIDVETGDSSKLDYKQLAGLQPKAFIFYRPLPSSMVSKKDVVRFCLDSVRSSDIIWLTVLSLLTALIGIITPTISQSLYDTYIPLGAKNVLLQLGSFAASFMIANVMFSIVKNLVNFRITSKMSYDMQAAVYSRLFSLPESFFRRFESADLAQRVMYTSSIVNTYASSAITSALAIVFLLVYFFRMLPYSGTLSAAGLLMVTLYSACFYFVALRGLKYQAKSAELDGQTQSIMFQFLNGIDKIRIAGMEDRAVYEYLKPYVRLREYEEKSNKIDSIQTLLSLISGSLFSCVLYVLIVKTNQNISYGAFAAFNSLFGTFAAYVIQIVENLIRLKSVAPLAERIKPILDEVPETDEASEIPGELTGDIEVNNVSFSYGEDTPLVLDGVNMKIKQGEYVAIVGPSGCGKSTLLKLLLGFEKPNTGKIYYDNKDIESVNKRELRKKIGVVLQGGSLISGSIYENITLTKPDATMKQVQEVVKSVGLADDIDNMPMGLHTVLSENCGTISGGQQQRILIARAIVSQPKILYFDEATSALDNITQSMVCATLEKLDSTRVVIAHRLSTIIDCDRIIVMEDGKIVEEGNYKELMNSKGLFYQLASRQLA